LTLLVETYLSLKMASNEDDETPEKRGVNDSPGNHGADGGGNHGLSADDFQNFCNSFLGSNNSPSLNLLMGTPNVRNNNTPNNNNLNMLTAAATAPGAASPHAFAATTAASLPVADEEDDDDDDDVDDEEKEDHPEQSMYATHQANGTHNAAKSCVEFYMKDFSSSAGKPRWQVYFLVLESLPKGKDC
jgi:hypothetical protein